MPTKTVDAAAAVDSGENARDEARKGRDPAEPAAVVGLGASAGGIAVLQQFFSDMPPDSGLAFVVVMHLSPEHESNLASVIQQKTTMPVEQVIEPTRVRPNHVYVIPPNKQLTFVEDTLQLLEPQQPTGRRATIDLFFRTLAQSYGHRSVGVILSGTDSDGVIGLKHIRAQGGVTIAQDPKEAEYDSMPLTAIATGMVDWVLPVSEMAQRLIDLVRNENLMRLVVVNSAHDIVHLSEHAEKYFRFMAGEPTANLLKVVDPALQVELRTALFRASRSQAAVEGAPIPIEVKGSSEVITINVRPIRADNSEEGFYLVTFAGQDKSTPEPPASPGRPDDLSRDLHAEIDILKRQLSTASEQYDAATEELKASNEELQAINEELQSAIEELAKVNHELENNVEELSKTNADLTNLMASTEIGTIFLDRQLCIKHFTPTLQAVFNVLPSDLGRPLSDITSNLEYTSLIADAEEALEKLIPVEREVKGGDLWFLVRIQACRTAEDKIDGVVATFVNITHRKSSELKLQELTQQQAGQLEQFNTVMMAVPDFIYHFDLAGRFTYVNQSLLDLWGKTLEEAIGKNFHELDYPPQLASKLQRQINEVIETGRNVTDETPFSTAGGGERQYEYIFFPLFAPDGRVEAVAGTTRDITSRKEAEENLAKSEARFRQFAENSADVFWIVDAETRKLEYLNPIFDEMWGFPRESILRKITDWSRFIHPDDRARALETTPRVLRGEQVVVVNYRIIRRSDGETRWIRDTGFPVRDEHGKVIRVAGVAQDITEEKERGEALRESEERFRLLVEGAPEYAMLMLDPSNHIIYWSVGAERVFGWKSDEALGQTGEIIFTPEDREREAEEKEMAIARRDGSAPDRRWHLRKDGSRIWVDGIMHRLNDENGELRGYAKIARDASDQRAVQEALEKSHNDLERRVKERTAELSKINQNLQKEIEERSRLEKEILLISEREKRRIGQDLHDSLCQELAATAFLLESKAQVLRDSAPEQAESFSESARVVNANVGVARDLARGMHPVELSTGGLANALRELCYRASHPKVDCRFHCPKPVRVREEAVALNLYRIAQEALSNAGKHAAASKVEVSLKRTARNLVLRVKDNGSGIALEEPTGRMGIHIMRYRASVMGGKLMVESKKGDGTTITCTVPGL